MLRDAGAGLMMALVVAATGCAPEQPATDAGAEPAAESMAATPAAAMDPTVVQSQVDRVRSAWSDAAKANDAAGVAALYTDDAVLISEDGAIHEGREAIQAAFAEGFATDLSINPTDFQTSGDLATEIGEYSGTMPGANGAPGQAMTGHYLVVLKHQPDGSWRIVHHLSAIPAAM